MQIDPTLLSEKNYTGTRLILIEDERIDELQKALTDEQLSINPVLDRLQEEYYSVIDPMYQEVQKLNERVKEIKANVAEKTKEFQPEIETIEATEQRAQLIKGKMQPIILKAVEGKLGEFETAKNTVVRDGKVYAEVYDEIEEKVKAIRASKSK